MVTSFVFALSVLFGGGGTAAIIVDWHYSYRALLSPYLPCPLTFATVLFLRSLYGNSG